MLAFRYVEQRKVPVTIIHMKIDDYIPFCEYFVIPYFLWFAYIAVTVFYFSFINKNKKEYWQLILTLGIGMTLFILISLVFPSCHTYRGRHLYPNGTASVSVGHSNQYPSKYPCVQHCGLLRGNFPTSGISQTQAAADWHRSFKSSDCTGYCIFKTAHSNRRHCRHCSVSLLLPAY